MRRRSIANSLAALLAAAAVAGVTAGPAAATGLSAAVADCNAHGKLTSGYSVPQLRTALATMPADIAEYTDCHDVIQQQLLAQLGGLRGGGPGSGGGAFLPTGVQAILIALGLIGSAYAGLAVRQRRAA